MPNNKFNKFVRYGGLSPVKQNGYDPRMPTYHSPPARRGIYAFLENHIEQFLLGKEEFDSRRFKWIRDSFGNKISVKDDMCENYPSSFSCKDTDGNFYICIPHSRKKFKYEGDIWHHHGEFCKEVEIIKRKGSWVLTSHEVYKEAVKKCLSKKHMFYLRQKIKYSDDDMEVFIERL